MIAELVIPNEIRYFVTTGDAFRYRNTENDIGTYTDTEWMIPNTFFRIFEFSTPTKNLHNMYVRYGHPSPY